VRISKPQNSRNNSYLKNNQKLTNPTTKLQHTITTKVYSRIFDERHDIAIAYLCKCQVGNIILNDEHSEYKYFKSLPKPIHPYLIQVIQDLRKKGNKGSS